MCGWKAGEKKAGRGEGEGYFIAMGIVHMFACLLYQTSTCALVYCTRLPHVVSADCTRKTGFGQASQRNGCG